MYVQRFYFFKRKEIRFQITDNSNGRNKKYREIYINVKLKHRSIIYLFEQLFFQDIIQIIYINLQQLFFYCKTYGLLLILQMCN